MLNILKIALLMAVVLVMASCAEDPKEPGYIFMPDMTYSQAYETYETTPFSEDSSMGIRPVPKTIPVGYTPFHYENNISDYARAGEELTNPLERTEENVKKGEYFYNIYCAICHGGTGEGNGKIVELQKFPPPPSYYNDYMMALPDGKMFFSMHFGKGLMGSYASQLTQKERWQVIHYINKLQEDKQSADQEGGGESDTTAQQ